MSTIAVYVDAAHERITNIVSRWGRQQTTSTGRWQIGVVCAGQEGVFFNRRLGVQDIFEAECWAALKGYEFARDVAPLATTIVIHTDAPLLFESRNAKATEYMQTLLTIARRDGITVEIEKIAGSDNPADDVSRRQQKPAEKAAPEMSQDEIDHLTATVEQRALDRAALKKQAKAAIKMKGLREQLLALDITPRRPGSKADAAPAARALTFAESIGMPHLQRDLLETIRKEIAK